MEATDKSAKLGRYLPKIKAWGEFLLKCRVLGVTS